MEHPIRILITGGTIDSYFDAPSDSIKVNNESVVGSYLKSLQLHTNFSTEVICLKDSRDLTNEDRQKMVEAINKSDADRFLITHGTYTMPDTARYLKQSLPENTNRRIILTGSMKPLLGFSVTDAPFNLGFAIASLLAKEPGIYLAMNGRCFDPEEVYKNISEGRFESFSEMMDSLINLA